MVALSVTVPSCSLCARLLHKHSEMWVIYSRAASNVWTVLGQVTAKIFPENLDTLFPANAYLCPVFVTWRSYLGIYLWHIDGSCHFLTYVI